MEVIFVLQNRHIVIAVQTIVQQAKGLLQEYPIANTVETQEKEGLSVLPKTEKHCLFKIIIMNDIWKTPIVAEKMICPFVTILTESIRSTTKGT